MLECAVAEVAWIDSGGFSGWCIVCGEGNWWFGILEVVRGERCVVAEEWNGICL